jgi:glutamine synthetase
VDLEGAPLAVDQLRAEVADGRVDTVLVAFTDMQGRLQGKRLHARYFLDEVLEHGTEGCNYLLAVDVDMSTVDGYPGTPRPCCSLPTSSGRTAAR